MRQKAFFKRMFRQDIFEEVTKPENVDVGKIMLHVLEFMTGESF